MIFELFICAVPREKLCLSPNYLLAKYLMDNSNCNRFELKRPFAARSTEPECISLKALEIFKNSTLNNIKKK